MTTRFDPICFAACQPGDNPLRPTGLVHIYPEPGNDVRHASDVIGAYWKHIARGVMCDAALEEGCTGRLSNLAAPSVVDDGHVVATRVTCPACIERVECAQ